MSYPAQVQRAGPQPARHPGRGHTEGQAVELRGAGFRRQGRAQQPRTGQGHPGDDPATPAQRGVGFAAGPGNLIHQRGRQHGHQLFPAPAPLLRSARHDARFALARSPRAWSMALS